MEMVIYLPFGYLTHQTEHLRFQEPQIIIVVIQFFLWATISIAMLNNQMVNHNVQYQNNIIPMNK